MKIYCARLFTQEELQWIAQLIEDNPQQRRAALSRQVCEQLNWKRPNGSLKDMACRVAMLRMQEDAVITLPATNLRQPRARPSYPPTQASDPKPGLCAPVHELDPLRMEIVRTGTRQSHLWNEYVARYHYLGYTPMSGSQMRYNIFAGDQLVALLSFGASAWKLADRERFIGWSEEQRSKNLQLVVNNARFLILPWIQSKGLASKILAMAAKRLPNDWLARYSYRPVMIETFVESPRHKGTCYKAANWGLVGRTAGRGKKSRSSKQVLPAKDIWLYPLRRDFPRILCG
jgi:hypothetical protein